MYNGTRTKRKASKLPILAVFYHARISCKPARAKESPLVAYEYDLSRDCLLYTSDAADE